MVYASTMAGHRVSVSPVELAVEKLAEGRVLKLVDIPVNEGQGYYLVSETADPTTVPPGFTAVRRL